MATKKKNKKRAPKDDRSKPMGQRMLDSMRRSDDYFSNVRTRKNNPIGRAMERGRKRRQASEEGLDSVRATLESNDRQEDTLQKAVDEFYRLLGKTSSKKKK